MNAKADAGVDEVLKMEQALADLLRQLVRKWNARGEVDMDLLRELADAFEQEEGPQR